MVFAHEFGSCLRDDSLAEPDETVFRTASVYCLTDPRDKKVAYVGCTYRRPEARMASHMVGEGGSEEKVEWINSLKEKKLTPDLELLEVRLVECAPGNLPPEPALSLEKKWIWLFQERGYDLVNAYNFPNGPLLAQPRFRAVLERWRSSGEDQAILIRSIEMRDVHCLRKLFDREFGECSIPIRTYPKGDRLHEVDALIRPPFSERDFDMEVTSPDRAHRLLRENESESKKSRHHPFSQILENTCISQAILVSGLSLTDAEGMRQYLYSHHPKNTLSFSRKKLPGGGHKVLLSPLPGFSEKRPSREPARAMEQVDVPGYAEEAWRLPSGAAESLLEATPPMPESRLEGIGDTLMASPDQTLRVKRLPKKHISQTREYLKKRFGDESITAESVHRGNAVYDLHIAFS